MYIYIRDRVYVFFMSKASTVTYPIVARYKVIM